MPDASLMALLPGGSVAAVLVVIIGILLRQNNQDRAQYREHITLTEAEHADEIRTIEARHVAAQERVEKQIRELNEKVSSTLADLEAERLKRWRAEDVAAQARRDLAAALEGDRT